MAATVPLIIVPTYWMRQKSARASSERASISHEAQVMGSETQAFYEHPTCIEETHTPLERLLDSLTHVRGTFRVGLIVGTNDKNLEVRADERVRDIADHFPQLDTFVFGPTEVGSLTRRLEQLELSALVGPLTLRSYGATRNLGLIMAVTSGCDKVIFLDDDDVVNDPDFLEKAVFGLGQAIYSGGYLLGKTGLAMNAQGRYLTEEHGRWTDRFWKWDQSRNQAVSELLTPPRLSPAKLAFGGCLALHAGLFARVAFDPWVTRGEDIDYVINTRLWGAQLYVDDQWTVLHLPVDTISQALRFRQDVFGFIYEHRKLEFAKSQVDLVQVTAESLAPYPGDFIDSSVSLRARLTALLRALGTKNERKTYWQAALHVTSDASDYARNHCGDYFAFQRQWPTMMDKLWNDVALRPLFTGERHMDRSALTGQFKAVGDTGFARSSATNDWSEGLLS